jgi:hypothetical protein
MVIFITFHKKSPNLFMIRGWGIFIDAVSFLLASVYQYDLGFWILLKYSWEIRLETNCLFLLVFRYQYQS